jgi:hypothetical protein
MSFRFRSPLIEKGRGPPPFRVTSAHAACGGATGPGGQLARMLRGT